MSGRCVCDVVTDTPVWHRKKRKSGSGLHTRHGAKHLSTCPHSDLQLTTKRFRRKKYRPVPGTRRIIAVDDND